MLASLKISIAMCTYNGEKYLQEQLDSFLQQTRLPDELVVCDDGSQDETVFLLRAFASEAPFPVHIHLNPQNLGFVKNFEKASCFCQGDIIAFADQDDVWLPHKLAEIERLFKEDPQVGCVFSNSTLVDEHLKPLGYSHWDLLGFTSRLHESFIQGDTLGLWLEKNYVSGAGMAFRANLRDLVLPIPTYWIHDHWISFVIRVFMKTAIIQDHLYKYRLHSSQLIGAKAIKLRDKWGTLFKMPHKDFKPNIVRLYAALLCLLSDSRLNNKPLIEYIEDKIEHCNVRDHMPNSILQRFPLVVREFFTGRYHRYSYGWKSVAKDLFLS